MLTKGRICDLPVDSVVVREGYNPRTNFDQQMLLGLGNSIKENSQLQPILINRIDGQNVLIAGERRLRAAKDAGIAFIEAKVYEDLDTLTAVRMTLAENTDRVDLNVIERARAFGKLIEHGVTEKEIAEAEGCSAATISNRLALLKLPEDVQRMMTRDDHPLPIHQALLLKGLSVSDQLSIARKAAPLGGPVASEEQVKQWVDDLSGDEMFDDDPPARRKHGKASHTPPPQPAAEVTPEQKKCSDHVKKSMNKDKKVRPVKGAAGINGKVSVGDDDVVDIHDATITVKIGDKVHTAHSGCLSLRGLSPADREKISKLIAGESKAKAAKKEKK